MTGAASVVEGRSGLRRYADGVTLALVLGLLFTGFGDGFAGTVRFRFGLPSLWLVLLPAVGAALFLAYRRGLPLPDLRYGAEAGFFICLLALGAVQQSVANEGYDIIGYAQFSVLVVLLVIVRAAFAEAPDWLHLRVPAAAVITHVALCGYLIAGVAAYPLIGRDISAINLLAPAVAVQPELYGYRPSGFSGEPSLAGLGVGFSYVLVFCAAPRFRIIGFVLLLFAGVATKAVAFFPVALVAALGLFLGERRITVKVVLLYIGVAAAGLILILFLPRLARIAGGGDASLVARANSIALNWREIVGAFPLGVGWNRINTGPEAVAGVEPSILFWLSLTAQLGAIGLLLIGAVLGGLSLGGHPLPVLMVATMGLLHGALLHPFTLVAAVATGYLVAERRRRAQRPAEESSSRWASAQRAT